MLQIFPSLYLWSCWIGMHFDQISCLCSLSELIKKLKLHCPNSKFSPSKKLVLWLRMKDLYLKTNRKILFHKHQHSGWISRGCLMLFPPLTFEPGILWWGTRALPMLYWSDKSTLFLYKQSKFKIHSQII